MYRCSLERMTDKIETFAQYGATGNGGITRYSLSPEAIQARREFLRRMEAIGAVIEMDDLANMYATLPGSDPAAKRIVMGSHCDSVKNGGNYDGILGVISAMEVLETVAAERIPHRHPLTAMIWTNEEGSLYPPSIMCSGVVCHDYLPADTAKFYVYEDILKSKSVLDGHTFGEALAACEFRGDRKNRLDPEHYLANFELHIEQGPILEDAGNDVGVVTCVLGMYTYRVSFFGQSDHAGTTPMPKRRDAFYAASLALNYLHEQVDALNMPELVYTTGQVSCHPNVHTIIPDFFQFSFDFRHRQLSKLQPVLDILYRLPERQWAGCDCKLELSWVRDAVDFDPRLVDHVKRSAEELGIPHQYINSGAGHDAQLVSYMLPTTMVFVASKDGHSHCELEYSSAEQCTNGASVLLNAVLKTDADF